MQALDPCFRRDDEQNQKRSAAISLRFAVAVAVAVLLLLARMMRACSYGGPSAAVSRGRSGRAAGVARDGNAFSRGQEPARKARPHLTHFPSMDGRKAPTGVPFLFGYFLFGHAKR
ncbi:hypothetical protein, partial [Rhodanobacter sp. PCA2]|uniref:hypothetical protein n=1 Tax=Rhodanobacter sp. PCA2 TaxID=2006117 RepID=UPI001C627F5D